jgi:hypothetical protein
MDAASMDEKLIFLRWFIIQKKYVWGMYYLIDIFIQIHTQNFSKTW